jgi:Tetratricopeptide repeat
MCPRCLTRACSILMVAALCLGANAQQAGTDDIDQMWDRVDRMVQAQRYADAAPLAEQVVDLAVLRYGERHRIVVDALNNLAIIYGRMGRPDKLIAVVERAGRIQAVGGADSTIDQNDFAALKERVQDLWDARKYGDAIPLARKLLGLAKAQSPDTDLLAEMLHNLGRLYQKTEQPESAAIWLQQSYDLRMKLLPQSDPRRALTAQWLATVQRERGRLAEAASLYAIALPVRERELGPDHETVIRGRRELLSLYLDLRNWPAALEQVKAVNRGYRSRSTRIALDTSIMREALEAQAQGDLQRYRSYALIETWLGYVVNGSVPGLIADSFASAQLAAYSDAAIALDRTAIRFGPRGNPRLVQLVHRRAALEHQRSRLFGQGVSAADSQRIDELDQDIKEVSAEVAREFPRYSALTLKEPVSLTDAQALLGPDEVLVLFVDTPGEGPIPELSFAWAITATDQRWVAINAGTRALAHAVGALRCGLDDALWQGGEIEDACVSVLKKHRYQANIGNQFVDVLPFDLSRARTSSTSCCSGRLTTWSRVST